VAGIQRPGPEEPSTFIGRENELGELRRLLSSARMLTLCGPGGIGKTRLALRLLASVTDEFADGTWFVQLGDLRQPDLVISQVASVLGVSEEPGRPLVETVAVVLRPRRLLLALDTCEHLIGPCAEVSEQLLAGSAGLRLVMTSREPLGVAGERVWQVPPLSVGPAGDSQQPVGSEAVRLFADRAVASCPGLALRPDDLAAVASICRALDGLPLAIELAAARARVLSVEQIRDRLDDRFALLSGDDRSAVPRQRTLRAAIDWSYDMLTEAQGRLFRRLSVFAGWSAEMAGEICAGDDLPAGDVLGLTSALVNKSLVAREPDALGQPRYRMLDTVREYAAARLAEAGESAGMQAALCDYILRTAERSLAIGMAQVLVPWSDRVDCSLRYDIESGNVSQALGWCLARADPEVGLRICVAVSPRWIVWGTFAEGCEWLDRFLALDISVVSAQVHGSALVVRAQLARAGDPLAAQALAARGLDLCRAGGDTFWAASALNLLSEIALQTGRVGEAETYADQALSMAHGASDGWNEGYALGTRAAAAARKGRLREAEQLATASVAVMRRIDQQWGAARALLGLGELARLRDHPGVAHERYSEALPILQEIGARPEIARCLAGLGRVAMDLDAIGQARRHLTRSIKLSQATGTRISVARGLEAFAVLAGLENQPEVLVQLTAAATALRERAGLAVRTEARTDAYHASARHLGESAIARLWAQGLAMTTEAAVALALNAAPAAAGPDSDGPALTIVRSGGPPATSGK
jgi:predicted ATPase